MKLSAPTLLVSRAETLLREIGRVERSLDELKVNFDVDLRERVVGRFKRELRRHREQLEEIRRQAVTAQALDEQWKAFALVDDELPGLFGECLAFLEGALARQHDLDEGLCAIADALLEELSRRSGVSWDRFTILADGEYYAAVSDMIRLRYSDTSVWNLPVAAHEFGHFAGPRLEVGGRRPFEGALRRESRMSPRRDALAREAFADVFATYTLGPAYAFACLLRFQPVAAHVDAPRHPSSAKRLRIILDALVRLDSSGSDAFGRVHDDIATAWRATLTGAGQSEEAKAGEGDVGLDVIDAWTSEFFGILEDALNPSARFDADRWLRSQQLAAALRNGRSAYTNKLPQLAATDTHAEVLNAAWYARSLDWEGTQVYGPAAFSLSGKLLAS